jgi:hypothetical protein
VSRSLIAGVLLGVATGGLATLGVALASPELYIDWGAMAAALIVIPLCTVGAATLVAVPMAVTRRIAWRVAAAAIITSLVVGELTFAASLNSSFARWSAVRHWAAVERRAAAQRGEIEQETCRRVLAEPPNPSPPAPPLGARESRAEPDTGRTMTLIWATRERCAELLRN